LVPAQYAGFKAHDAAEKQATKRGYQGYEQAQEYQYPGWVFCLFGFFAGYGIHAFIINHFHLINKAAVDNPDNFV
jgi:hypothetical protein